MKRKKTGALALAVCLSAATVLGGCEKKPETTGTDVHVLSPASDDAQQQEDAQADKPGQAADADNVTDNTEAGGDDTAAAADDGAASADAQEGSTQDDAAETSTGRKDGERFEDVIILEGMEEPVKYEHMVNNTLGFEMDFDYESLTRISGSDSERLVSIYDNADAPENYLELTCSSDDAETAAAAISAELSKTYDVNRESYPLDNAGSCIRLDASAEVGGQVMPKQLQMVYVIPAPDGCRIVTAHYSIEAAEGFGHRFAYMVNTLKVTESGR